MLCMDKSRFVSPAEAAEKAVRDGDWVDYGFGGGFPELIAGRKGALSNVKIRGGLVIRPRIEVVEQDPEQSSFSYHSWHIGDYERKLQSRGLCSFMPMILRFLPNLYRHHIQVDAAFVPVSRPTARAIAAWAFPTTPGAQSLKTPALWFLRSTSICPGSRE